MKEEAFNFIECLQVLEEAFHFLESMGFIMDHIDLRSLSVAEREEYFQQQPFFPAPQEDVPQELTEEVVEEASVPTQELQELTEEIVEEGSARESKASEKIGRAIQDLVEGSPEQGEMSSLEKSYKSTEDKARTSDPAFALWGRLLASF